MFIPSCSHQPRIFSCVLGPENSIFPLPPAMVMVLPVRVPSNFRRVIFAAVSTLLLLLLHGMIFIGIHKKDRPLHQLSLSVNSSHVKASSNPLGDEDKKGPSNSLHEFELYLRYTTLNKDFPKQAEDWILRSMSLFWPKNSKIVVVLDEEYGPRPCELDLEFPRNS